MYQDNTKMKTMEKPEDCDILHQDSPRPQEQTLLHGRGRPDIISYIIHT